MKPLSKCSFNKWRCLIALAYIDNKFQPAEREFFMHKFKNLKGEAITEEQMKVFLDDLKIPKKPNQFFQDIQDRDEKIDLLKLAYELFWADGDFDQREQEAYRQLRSYLSRDLKVDRFILDDLAKGKLDKLPFDKVMDTVFEVDFDDQ